MAIKQRESVICGRRGVSTGEYARVAQIFTAVRIALPGAPVTGDRLIKWFAVAVIVTVAAIAAVVSYSHALALVEAHGESGRGPPGAADRRRRGLHQLHGAVVVGPPTTPPASPGLWPAGTGIGATLAANEAYGLAHGPAGAAGAPGWATGTRTKAGTPPYRS